MKKLTIFALLVVLFCGTALSAKDFDWSECWCNYGGGVEKGDLIINLGGGFYYSDLDYAKYDDFWFIPPAMVEVQFAQPIWKLPFTFGAYAGFHGYHYNYNTLENGKTVKKDAYFWGTFFGGEAAYHIMLPPDGLDLYAVTRVGGSIPFVKPGSYWEPDYFHVGEAIGATWYFGKVFGLNLEFGYPFSKVGVSFKFQDYKNTRYSVFVLKFQYFKYEFA